MVLIRKYLRRMLPLFVLCAIAGCSARQVKAQFTGYVGLQTVAPGDVFSNTSCATSPTMSAALPNIGQSVYIVNYSLAFNPGSVSPIVRILGSSDGVLYYPISDDGMSQNGFLVGYGVYNYIKIAVYGGSGGCTITAAYNGSFAPPSIFPGNPDQTTYQKYLFTAVSAGTSQSANTFTPPYGTSAGFVALTATSAGFPSGSTFSVAMADPNTVDGTTVATYPLAAIGGTQYFAIPAVSGSEVSVTYTAGGASSNTFSATYIFTKPGIVNTPLGENPLVVNTASAGPTRVIVHSGSESARILSINLSSGTAEAIDLQQGTGTNCGTGNSQLTGLTHLAANAPWIQNFPGAGLIAKPGNDVCIHLSGANQTDGTITYSQY
jgi:hypothetical protein